MSHRYLRVVALLVTMCVSLPAISGCGSDQPRGAIAPTPPGSPALGSSSDTIVPAVPVADATRSQAGNRSLLGVDAYERGDYDQAVTFFTEAINLEPTNARYHCNRATAYDAKGAYDQAIEDYSQAIKLDSNYTDAYYGRATINLIRGKYDEALSDFDQTIRLDPVHVGAHHNRGIVYYSRGDYSTAIVDYTKAIVLAKPSELDLERVYDSRALAYQGTFEHKLAIEDYTRALEIAPDFWHSYIGRARSYAVTGEKDKAIADYLTVLQSSASDDFKQEAKDQFDALVK